MLLIKIKLLMLFIKTTKTIKLTCKKNPKEVAILWATADDFLYHF